MKISMLGLSGSGKTSYFGGLYQALSENTIHDFSLMPKLTNGKEGVYAVPDWQTLALHNRKSGFAMGTAHTTIWSFQLLHLGDPVCSFEWIDYRGGDLEDLIRTNAGKDQAEQERQKHLLLQIVDSNAVIIFADALKLALYNNASARRKFCGADVINNVIRICASTYPHRAMTVVIVLSKTDSEQIDDRFKANNYAELVNRALTTFSEVTSLCRTKPNWRGAVLPISVVGNGNVETTINYPAPEEWHLPYTSSTKVIGFPEQMNTEHALFYCLGETLARMATNANAAIMEYEQQISDAIANSGFFRTIAASLTGQMTPREIVRKLVEQKNEEMIMLRKYEPHIMHLFELAQQKVIRI